MKMKNAAFAALAAIAAASAGAVLAAEAVFSTISKRNSAIYINGVKKGLKKALEKEKRTGVIKSAAISGTGADDGKTERLSDSYVPDNALPITVESCDGLNLAGYWYPAENAKRTCILIHGWRGSWQKDFHYQVPFLHENGCNLLLVDQRGHGKSEGEFISFGILERYDVLTWLSKVSELSREGEKALPVYLYGVSMGASTVLMSSELLPKGAVAGIIADCGYTSADAVLKTTLKKCKMPSELSYAAADVSFRLRAGLSYSSCSATDALKLCNVPVFFVHGDADNFVPVEMTYLNFEACSSEKEMLIVHSAGHAESFEKDEKEYSDRLISFFVKFDDNSSPKTAPEESADNCGISSEEQNNVAEQTDMEEKAE